jgi:hypothetical protein
VSNHQDQPPTATAGQGRVRPGSTTRPPTSRVCGPGSSTDHATGPPTGNPIPLPPSTVLSPPERSARPPPLPSVAPVGPPPSVRKVTGWGRGQARCPCPIAHGQGPRPPSTASRSHTVTARRTRRVTQEGHDGAPPQYGRRSILRSGAPGKTLDLARSSVTLARVTARLAGTKSSQRPRQGQALQTARGLSPRVVHEPAVVDLHDLGSPGEPSLERLPVGSFESASSGSDQSARSVEVATGWRCSRPGRRVGVELLAVLHHVRVGEVRVEHGFREGRRRSRSLRIGPSRPLPDFRSRTR